MLPISAANAVLGINQSTALREEFSAQDAVCKSMGQFEHLLDVLAALPLGVRFFYESTARFSMGIIYAVTRTSVQNGLLARGLIPEVHKVMMLVAPVCEFMHEDAFGELATVCRFQSIVTWNKRNVVGCLVASVKAVQVAQILIQGSFCVGLVE
ncbi:hypothetical protein Nm8I071_24040 [Nonomuraea sp. TT08I-71]|nr:hypothetical protein Nm8I071_24040 [Nonomuraea sp. TT08I-71]